MQAPPPVHEENDDMDRDEEEPEADEERKGTRDITIDVAEEVVVPREVPKPVEEKQKPRVEEATTDELPKRATAAAVMGQWAGGPPKDRRRVVVDESSVGVSRQERREAEETTTRLGAPKQEVKLDVSQLIRRSEVCPCSRHGGADCGNRSVDNR